MNDRWWESLDKVAILGAGQMGVLAAWFLSDPALRFHPLSPLPREVWLWGHDPLEVEEIQTTRQLHRLPGLTLPEDVQVVSDPFEAVRDAQLLVCATPVRGVRPLFRRIKDTVDPQAGLLNLSKGLDYDQGQTPTRVMLEELGEIVEPDFSPWWEITADPDKSRPTPRPCGTLAGPMIAKELARGLPSVGMLVANHPVFTRTLQHAFATPFFRVYSTLTPEATEGSSRQGGQEKSRAWTIESVEKISAYKHVVAIAAGVLDGLNAGVNAKSALLARGMAEMGIHHLDDVVVDIVGVGDLTTSCFSPAGRNRALGEALGRGVSLKEHLASADSFIEGVDTVKILCHMEELGIRPGLSWRNPCLPQPKERPTVPRDVIELGPHTRDRMPIAAAVYDVLFHKVDPVKAIEQLMRRPLREYAFDGSEKTDERWWAAAEPLEEAAEDEA